MIGDQIKIGAAAFSVSHDGARIPVSLALPAVQREIGQAVAAALRTGFENAVL